MVLMTMLLRRCADYETKNGQRPVAIYLGRETLCALKMQLHWSSLMDVEARRQEFNGIPIFTVDEDHHMNVG